MSGTLEKRFRRKLSEKRPNGCIEWLGWKNNSGYGMVRAGSANCGHLLAHRASYQIHFGPIPAGMVVMHVCDNKVCVNPEHLKLGSQQDNVDDMVAKDRQKRSALNHEEVRKMRSLGLTQREIALHFCVSRPLISLILSGKISRSN